MKKTTLLLLTLALALSLCACGKEKETATTTGVTEAVPVATTVLDADYVEYYDGSVTTRFRREEGKWVWADDASFPLDGARVDEILAGAADFGTLSALPESGDTADYGLSGAEMYLTLTVGEDFFTYYFGKQAEDGSTYMCCSGSETVVYLVPDTFMVLLRSSVYDMALLPQMPELTAENVKSIIVESAQKEIVTVIKSNEGWKSGGRDVSAKMEPVLASLGGMTLEGCFDYAPSPAAVGLCGFDPPTVTVTILYVNSVKVDTSLLLRVGKEQGESGLYCVMLEGDPSVYLMPDEVLDPLLQLGGVSAE